MTFHRSLRGLLMAATLAAAPYAAAGTIVVNPNTTSWFTSQDGFAGSATFAFVVGPAPATGSIQMTVDSSARAQIETLGYAGKRFDQMTTLKYTSQNVTPMSPATIALQFDVDFDLTDGDNQYQGRLVFEPYEGQAVNPLVDGTWQEWDANAGYWWASRSAQFAGGHCTQAVPCSKAEVLTLFPNIGVREPGGALLLRLGGPIVGGGTAAIDKLTVNDTTWDFQSLPDSGSSNCGGYSDVSPSDSYCNAVEWMANRGVTLGCTATDYCPSDPVTRAQMAIFMKRLGSTLSPTRTTIPGVLGAIDLDTPTYLCMSPVFNPGNFPKTAVVTANVSARTTAAADFAVNVFYNAAPDNATFPTAVAAVDSIAGSAGTSYASASVTGDLELAVNTNYQFAVRLARAGGTGDLASGGTCSLTVELRSRTSTTTPFDHG